MTQHLAAFSARRPLIIIAVWVLLVIVCLGVVGRFLDSATTTDLRLAGRYESEQAAAMLEDRLRGPRKLAEIVIIKSDSMTVDDPDFRARVETVHAQISALGPDIVSGGIDNRRVSDFAPDLVAAGFPDQPVSHYYQILDAGPALSQEETMQLFPILVSADRDTVMLHYTLAGSADQGHRQRPRDNPPR